MTHTKITPDRLKARIDEFSKTTHELLGTSSSLTPLSSAMIVVGAYQSLGSEGVQRSAPSDTEQRLEAALSTISFLEGCQRNSGSQIAGLQSELAAAKKPSNEHDAQTLEALTRLTETSGELREEIKKLESAKANATEAWRNETAHAKFWRDKCVVLQQTCADLRRELEEMPTLAEPSRAESAALRYAKVTNDEAERARAIGHRHQSENGQLKIRNRALAEVIERGGAANRQLVDEGAAARKQVEELSAKNAELQKRNDSQAKLLHVKRYDIIGSRSFTDKNGNPTLF